MEGRDDPLKCIRVERGRLSAFSGFENMVGNERSIERGKPLGIKVSKERSQSYSHSDPKFIRVL